MPSSGWNAAQLTITSLQKVIAPLRYGERLLVAALNDRWDKAVADSTDQPAWRSCARAGGASTYMCRQECCGE